jgi:hypothetical protein
VRHESLCSGTTRKGQPCAKIGHRLAPNGERWCGSHSPPPGEYVKQPYPCAGLDVHGVLCRNAADAVLVHEGDELALCRFHLELVDELGVIRTPAGYGKLKRAERAAQANADRRVDDRDDDVVNDSNGALPGDAIDELRKPNEGAMQRIRARFADLGPTVEAMIDVLEDGLKAFRWVTFNCASCGRRNRVNVADQATRQSAVKLIGDLGAPKENEADGPGWAYATDFEPWSADTAPTRELISLAFPDREAWTLRHQREGSLGALVSEILEVHRRDAAGLWVKEDELERKRREHGELLELYNLIAPITGLNFTGSSVTTP